MVGEAVKVELLEEGETLGINVPIEVGDRVVVDTLELDDGIELIASVV